MMKQPPDEQISVPRKGRTNQPSALFVYMSTGAFVLYVGLSIYEVCMWGFDWCAG